MDTKKIKSNIIKAGLEAIDELVKVAKEKIVVDNETESMEDEELAADKLKNAAATKKLAIFDAFEILNRIEAEQLALEDKPQKEKEVISGFAEKKSR